MKSILFVLFLSTFYSSILISQEVQESMQDMSLGQQNAILFESTYDSKFADGVWKDYLKTFNGKSRKVKKGDEWFTDDASIAQVSANPIDLYSLVTRTSGGFQLRIWVDMGGTFVSSSSHPDAFEGIKSMLRGFEKQLNVETIKIELKNEQDRLKDHEKELTRLERLNEKYHKEIEEWKQKIAQNEDLIKTNFKDQDDLKKTIEVQKETVKSVEIKLAKAES